MLEEKIVSVRFPVDGRTYTHIEYGVAYNGTQYYTYDRAYNNKKIHQTCYTFADKDKCLEMFGNFVEKHLRNELGGKVNIFRVRSE